MPHRTLRLLGFALAFVAPAVFGQLAPIDDVAAELRGNLVALRGKSALPYDDPGLAKTKYIALYFSAGWCPPCHQFTPYLVNFYQEMKPKHPEFEVVLMSLDRGQNAMEKYMGESNMPWPALRFSALRDSPLLRYAGSGIPDLVVLNRQGEVLANSFVDEQYVGPYQALADLRRILSANSAADPPNDVSTASPSPSSATEKAKPSGVTDSGNTPKGKSP